VVRTKITFVTSITGPRPGRPLIYAHRGGAALRPENTFAAFDHGLSLGADGLELDIRLSRDGVVVVHHDATLERTTDGRGALADHSSDELARLDAGYHFQPRGAGNGGFPFRGQGLRIPTLASVLQRYPDVPLIIELKVDVEEIVQRTIDLVKRAGALTRVALGSFSGRALSAARRIEPGLRTGAAREETRWALYRSWVGWPLGRPRYQEFQVPERSGLTTVVTRRFVQHAHRAGVGVKVWTIDDESDITRLLAWGVDGIISDRPDIAAAVVSARASRRS
jgi:glycerophosphoryl diester phosphodiesterase